MSYHMKIFRRTFPRTLQIENVAWHLWRGEFCWIFLLTDHFSHRPGNVGHSYMADQLTNRNGERNRITVRKFWKPICWTRSKLGNMICKMFVVYHSSCDMTISRVISELITVQFEKFARKRPSSSIKCAHSDEWSNFYFL